MQLKRKIQSVNSLFNELDKDMVRLKRESGLSCIVDCGDCCLKNDIDATVLEFLPAAYSIFLGNKHEEFLSRLETNSDTICAFYTPFNGKGFCSNYKNRGLICRLFGFSVRLDKYENKSFVTCKKIKNTISNGVLDKIISLAPEITSYYMKLFGIDPKLAIQQFPINEAIKKALDTVLMHYQYKKRRA